MLFIYIKITAIIIFIAIGFKFAIKMITFNTNDYHIKDARASAILGLIIIIINLIISIIFQLIVAKYFMNASGKEAFLLQSTVYLFQLSIILTAVIFRKERISSVGITKNNILKSIIIGILMGIIYYILVRNVFKVNTNMNIISVTSFNTFISFFIVGFVEEVCFRGYLQTRLITWLGTMKGWLLTALIFAFFHLTNRVIFAGMNFTSALISCVILIPISLLYGYIMIKTKNVIASSVYHTFTDWTETVMSIVG